MPDQTQRELTPAPAPMLVFPPNVTVDTIVCVEFLNGERRHVRVDELHTLRRAFRFVPAEVTR